MQPEDSEAPNLGQGSKRAVDEKRFLSRHFMMA